MQPTAHLVTWDNYSILIIPQIFGSGYLLVVHSQLKHSSFNLKLIQGNLCLQYFAQNDNFKIYMYAELMGKVLGLLM